MATESDNPIADEIDDASTEQLKHADEVIEGIEGEDAHAADAEPDGLAPGESYDE